MTNFTRHIHIWQEVHFNFDDPVPATCFTASAFYIKTKASFLIAANFRFIRFGKNIPYIIKYSCIGCRVGSRRPSDRAWSISMTFSKCSIPLITLCAPRFFARFNLFASVLYKISFTNVLFPEPDTPVTAIKFLMGIYINIF